jgi:DNA-binding HxlR family transcriptional regulator
MRLDAVILDDAIRRSLPAGVADLRAATGVSEPTLHRALKRLGRLSCVTRTAAHVGAADVWREATGATWAHLARQGVHLG